MPLILVDSLLDLRRVALNSTKDRGWIDRDTTLLHHFRQIAIADAVFAVPAHAQQDDFNWKATALEDIQHLSGDWPVRMGISKIGSQPFRAMIVHGPRVMVRTTPNKTDPANQWVYQLRERRSFS